MPGLVIQSLSMYNEKDGRFVWVKACILSFLRLHTFSRHKSRDCIPCYLELRPLRLSSVIIVIALSEDISKYSILSVTNGHKLHITVATRDIDHYEEHHDMSKLM